MRGVEVYLLIVVFNSWRRGLGIEKSGQLLVIECLALHGSMSLVEDLLAQQAVVCNL